MPQVREDQDSAWKEALEFFFQPFLELLFPKLYAVIDWSRPVTFLDKELQKFEPSSNSGRRYADKLAQVWLRQGGECWVLIHVEVQGEAEAGFQERMFVYYYRIRDHYRNQPVISLAVLTDTNARYRPDCFEEVGKDGYGIRFRFRTVKLLDFQPRLDELLASDNPFALLVAAQLTAKLVKSGRQKADNLLGFYRLASRKRLDRKLITRLIVFLEWLVALPPEIEAYYNAGVDRLKEENTVPYVSIMERRWTKQGLEKGIEKGIRIGEDRGRAEGLSEGRAAVLLRQLQLKFGDLPEELQQRVTQAGQAELDLWAERILFVGSLEAVFAAV
ncbi:MAG TPA: DUF4351 domain-containing protein [Hyphomicrobiales bacterium]|nr:DUF4351 domain-containing protein [Hyphomicrobiales bacterium]